ncbi:hypothetical protein D3C76_1388890 [compost metagenome]
MCNNKNLWQRCVWQPGFVSCSLRRFEQLLANGRHNGDRLLYAIGPCRLFTRFSGLLAGNLLVCRVSLCQKGSQIHDRSLAVRILYPHRQKVARMTLQLFKIMATKLASLSDPVFTPGLRDALKAHPCHSAKAAQR